MENPIALNINGNIIVTNIQGRNAIQTALDEQYQEPQPMRLVLVSIYGCQFCPTHEENYMTFVSREDNLGYLHCDSCSKKAMEAREKWINRSLAPIQHLRNKNIKVRRTSGDIEEDWQINEGRPMISTDQAGKKYVHCYQPSSGFYRSCYLEELLELNSF